MVISFRATWGWGRAVLRRPVRGALRARRSGGALLLIVVGLLGAACSQEPFSMDAQGPVAYLADYPAASNPPQERVAILVTITNRGGDDLQVSPADFVARDPGRRVYPANPVATAADARPVRLAMKAQGLPDTPPLPTITLRKDDVVSGFVVFDVPAGVRPVDIIWRQTDGDSVVHLSPLQ